MLTIEKLAVDVTPGVTPVENFDLDIGPGETVALVGESGSGKTTVALAVLRLLADGASIRSGSRIEFEGRSTLDASPQEMADLRGSGIAMMFQDPLTSLHPHFQIGDQIAEAMHHIPRDERGDRVRQLLAEVGLGLSEDVSTSYPHELSGGMLQRVGLAVALAGAPRLLIADEPTSALDVVTNVEMIDLLQAATASHNMALLIITHDLRIVARIAPRIVVMYAGRKIEELPAETSIANAKHPYTIALRDSWARDGGTAPLAGMPPLPGAFPSGCRFHPRCPHRMAHCDTDPPRRQWNGHSYDCWLGEEE